MYVFWGRTVLFNTIFAGVLLPQIVLAIPQYLLLSKVAWPWVRPWITLYHWDLPQELEDEGGWPVRDTAYRFAGYAMLVFDQLSDRVQTWTTLNEPWCSAMLGYAYGRQAPGRQDLPAAISAVHHLLLGHGLATQRMRAAAARPVELGITLNMGTSDRETDSAAHRADGLAARIYLDPLVHGRYPADVVEDLAARGIRIPVRPGDLGVISAPMDVKVVR